MDELLNVNSDNQTVSARSIYKELEIEQRFSAWFENNSQGFIEGEDYTTVLINTEVQNNGGVQMREMVDHNCSMDMAKHICLMSRTEKGKKCRQYLIDIEKAWNTPEQILARALKVADETIASLNTKINGMQPKVEFFDAVAESKDAISMAEVAKVLDLGIGRNKLFEFLRTEHILQHDNQPYQKYVDAGYFRIIEQKYNVGDEVRINLKTIVYQKGINFIRKKWNERLYAEPILSMNDWED